jgi:hypothetical protein
VAVAVAVAVAVVDAAVVDAERDARRRGGGGGVAVVERDRKVIVSAAGGTNTSGGAWTVGGDVAGSCCIDVGIVGLVEVGGNKVGDGGDIGSVPDNNDDTAEYTDVAARIRGDLRGVMSADSNAFLRLGMMDNV